jgi:hypothetical protein
MIKSYLAAAIALAMITGVALGQSPTLTTVSPGSVAGGITTETSIQPNAQGNGGMGQFWTTVNANFPTRNDDVPKTVKFARPVSETASR